MTVTPPSIGLRGDFLGHAGPVARDLKRQIGNSHRGVRGTTAFDAMIPSGAAGPCPLTAWQPRSNMCGILGSWQFDAQARGDAEDALARALPLIRHRGPDDIGTAAIPTAAGRLLFGHTRLAIIDLSAAGHQPMIRGTLSVVFNGEIYNYRELRQELRGLGHSFSTDTDTEVLLAAWQQWQQAALRRFTGMFAFALHDARDDSLTLARDAFGIKPLYYSLDGRRLLFGSEIAPLRALDPGLRRLDWQRACDYLSYGRYDCDERTFIQGISQIEPGCLIRYHIQDGVHPARWWTPRTAPTWRGSFADAAAEFRERFLDSVRLHLRSDVPVGAALSGGLDSASITCAMRHLEPDIPLHTFSYIAEGPQSEAKWAQLVNQHCAAQAHEVRVDTADLERDLDALIGARASPSAAPASMRSTASSNWRANTASWSHLKARAPTNCWPATAAIPSKDSAACSKAAIPCRRWPTRADRPTWDAIPCACWRKAWPACPANGDTKRCGGAPRAGPPGSAASCWPKRASRPAPCCRPSARARAAGA